MKSRSMKKFMRKAVSAVSAVAMAIMLAAPAVSTQAFAADGKAAAEGLRRAVHDRRGRRLRAADAGQVSGERAQVHHGG